MKILTADINWPVIIIVGMLALGLIIFLVKRNLKDKKDVEDTLNQVEKKPPEHDSDNE